MAKYQRDFLVPYLMNVCSLQLACKKLEDKERSINGQIATLNYGLIPTKEPRKPQLEPAPPFGVFMLVMGCLTILMSFLMFALELDFLGWFLLLGGIGEGIFGFVLVRNVKVENQNKEYYYWQELHKYQRDEKANTESRRKKLPKLQADLDNCRYERQKAHAALHRAYSINVIPMQYRDLYTSVYLYRLFDTSQADDLEMALSMYMLDDIRAKLDQVIANQTSMILNEQFMIANQQRSLEQQRAHSDMMCRKLASIEASNEERNMYLSMIESNTATTAYFATADYIRHI